MKTADEVNYLEGRISELEKDAARYRFTRQYWLDGQFDMPDDAFHAKTPEAFDAAIDVAMKEK